ncbi:MAG: hypothetical protein KKF27_22110 [Gammaproteobacteria bacterium]|nr:hypothetical protein [Gammaproteobacteria bacterium]
MDKAASLADMDVDTALLQSVWESKVATEKVLFDPLLAATKGSVSDMITVDDQTPSGLPVGKAVINVTPKNKGARKVTCAFLQALDDGGRYGTDTLIAYEEERRMKHVSGYANDWKHEVPLDTYGINYRELSPYNIYKATKTDLARWYGENEGYFLRSAIIEGRSPNLASSPISAYQPLNPNCYVLSIADASQPSRYSDDDGGNDMEDELGDVVNTATYTSMHNTVPRILAMTKFARINRYTNPLSLPNGPGYLYFVSPAEMLLLRDASQSNSFGYQWLSGAAIQNSADLVPGLKFVVGEAYVVEDPRCPTITLTGQASSDYTISVGYMKHGRTDDRATGTTALTHLDVNYLLGEGAVLYYEAEAPHYEKQLDEYGQYENVAYIGACGYCRTDWNVDTNNDSTPTIQHEGSMLVLSQRA